MSQDQSDAAPLERPPELPSQVDPEDLPLETMAVAEAEAAGDSAGAIRSGKLAGKSIGAAIWIVALPILFQQTMQACVGLVDKVLAGKLPSDIAVPAMDGLGIGAYIGWFTGIAMAGLGAGAQAVIARGMGAGNRDETHRALGQAVTLSFLWGFAVGIVLWVSVHPLARYCQLSPEATLYCEQYVRILAYSMPMCGIMMVGGMCLHGAGETTQPSIISVWVNVVNIVFSWALSGVDLRFGDFVLINPFSFDMDVRGIAAGTAIAYVIGALLTLRVLWRGVRDLRLERVHLPLRWSMTRRLVRLGVPNFLEGIAMWAVNLFVLGFIGEAAQRLVERGGDAEGLQGAHLITVQWESFSFLPGFAIGTAAGALAGQYLGAGNAAMARKAILICTGLTMALMGAAGVLFIVAGEWLTTIISDAPIHLQTVPRLLAICGYVQVFFALTMVMRQGLRGVGDANWTFLITTASCYGVRLPAAYLLGVHFDLGIEGIWYALCGELVVRSFLFTARFAHGGWRRVKV